MTSPHAPARRPSRLVLAGLLALAAACALRPAATSAHPFARSFYSHRVVAQVDGETLQVDYTAEVPTRAVMAAFYQAYGERRDIGEKEDAEFLDRTLAGLAAGLRVTASGRALALTDATPRGPLNGRGDQRFFRYRVRLVGPLPIAPGERVELRVANANHAGLPAYFSGAVRAPDDLVVVEGNVTLLPAEARLDDPEKVAAAWTPDPAFRDLTFVVARDRAGWAGAVQRRWRWVKERLGSR